MASLNLQTMKVKLYADGADIKGVKSLAANPLIKGFTTNPTLMRQSGITDYVSFAKDMLGVVGDRPVSFEVFADDMPSMQRQAQTIAEWAPNVYVKIPVTNTKGEFCGPLIKRLASEGVQLNVTAILSLEQVEKVAEAIADDTASVISVFAGRIADTGRDPIPLMAKAREILAHRRKAELLWASPREILNLLHADEAGCHIITVSHDILKKLSLIGKNLDEYSLETVAMFFRDATAAGFSIPEREARSAAE